MILVDEIRSAFKYDPAARNVLEVILAYPGIHAIWMHRIAHFLWRLRVPVLPRLVSHLTRWLTGIEIHPGAKIGRGVFIDHGAGVVIGETAEVGDECVLYQGVTLGGTSFSKGKRHPTLEDHVVVGAGAKILGNIRIGSHSRIGANAVVLKSVPPHSVVVGVPGRIKKIAGKEPEPLEHDKIPDPIAEELARAYRRIEELERQVEELRRLWVDERVR
jgi:serine O-acetyltransferase